jgi:lipopolysaccharide transport system permease protein
VTTLKDNVFARYLLYNPLFYILELIRTPVVEGTLPAFKVYFIACSTVSMTFLVAAWALSKSQRRLVFHL